MLDVIITTPLEQATITDEGIQLALKKHIEKNTGRKVLGAVRIEIDTNYPQMLGDLRTERYRAAANLEPESKA